mgnify:CR=1 FL=1
MTDWKSIVVAETQVSTEASPGTVPGGWQARVLEKGIERALRTQQPLVAAHVAAIRRKRPQASPAEVIESSALFALAVAEVHALPTDTPERRRALVLSVITGESGQAALRKFTGKSGDWAGDITNALPLAKLGPLNLALTRWFIKRYVIRQSVLALGRALPLGIGLVIGAVGNLVVARAVIRAAERVFGAPPEQWPGSAAAVPAAPERQPSVER